MTNERKKDEVAHLLTDILAATKERAEEESQKILKLKRARDEERIAAEVRLQQEKREKIRRDLDAEAKRRQAASQRRQELIRAIEGPSEARVTVLRTKEESAQRSKSQARLESIEAARIEAEDRVRRILADDHLRPLDAEQFPPVRTRRIPALALSLALGSMAMVFMLLITAAVVVFGAQSPESLQPRQFTKLAIQPTSLNSGETEVGFIPNAVVAERAPKARANCDARCQRLRRTRINNRKPREAKKNNSFKFENIDSDPFDPTRK